ncbi:hypothetical protein N0V94_007915 [Neodidymelliopsis sp. IMI 364377]|nr:hypothetical protein N0V94_007915 [Neodidymelliopsis sp. IMI 364377]
MATPQTAPVALPRVAITYCTQCRWMLRAAYFGQELLSTFGLQIGEIALIPATSGLFQVELTYIPPSSTSAQPEKILLWDRKTEGGFPETKVLKQKVRDRIDPKKDLGHSDVGGKKKEAVKQDGQGEEKEGVSEEVTREEKENEGKKEEKPEEGSVADSSVDGGAELKRNPDGTICEDCR